MSHNIYLYSFILSNRSNSIWAFASAGIRCDGQRRLIQCVADTLDQDNGKILREFKPQELSNTVSFVKTIEDYYSFIYFGKTHTHVFIFKLPFKINLN